MAVTCACANAPGAHAQRVTRQFGMETLCGTHNPAHAHTFRNTHTNTTHTHTHAILLIQFACEVFRTRTRISMLRSVRGVCAPFGACPLDELSLLHARKSFARMSRPVSVPRVARTHTQTL